MSVKVEIKDGRGTGNHARVSQVGQLITGPFSYSLPKSVNLDVINTAYNIAKPLAGKRIVITDLLIYANKNVGATDATVIIYEADSVTNTTALREIVNVEIPKNEKFILTGLNWITSSDVFLNAKTDDDDVFIVAGVYYVDAGIDTTPIDI